MSGADCTYFVYIRGSRNVKNVTRKYGTELYKYFAGTLSLESVMQIGAQNAPICIAGENKIIRVANWLLNIRTRIRNWHKCYRITARNRKIGTM